jgi:3-hydroxyacyl-[acyl-carrier-protein] dehydratase
VSLPYAAPLRATDEVEVATRDGGVTVRATKLVRATDPYLAAHFPGQVVYPGVFVLETVRQAVLTALGPRAGRLPELSVVRSVRFRHPLRPGQRLRVTADIEAPAEAGSAEEGAIVVRARCRCDGGADVATLVLEFQYDHPGQPR